MTKKAIMFVVLLITCYVSDTDATTPRQITVTDIIGRQVSIVVPVKRVVLASARDIHIFAAVAGKDGYKKIVGWGSDLKLFDRDTYIKYKERFPKIEGIPDIGYHLRGTFNIEKVISLRPDVVIVPKWILDQEDALNDMDRLNRIGIPSIATDYWEKPFENTVPSTILLGTLLGKEKRAQEIVNFYLKQMSIVTTRLQKINKPKPRVYVEGGWKGPSEYGGSYGDDVGWGAIVVKSGGTNIAEGIIPKGTTAPISPEYLLKANPDVIIISGSYWPETKGAMRLGYYAKIKESRRLLLAYTKRPGWNTLTAVQNRKVYSIFHPWCKFIQHFVAIQSFAKWFYPDEFKDLNPEKNLKEFHRRFLPVDYSGVWMLGIKKE